MQPIHARVTNGEPFDFGTHANDFLVSREQTLATETFLVRVPGSGAVPEHVHTDMEQTFVFLSGVGRATLTRDDDVRSFQCVPGDSVFVPTGWRHTVKSESLEGVAYLTINAFVLGVDRIGDTALAHAEEVNVVFAAHRGQSSISDGDPLAVFRTAETSFFRDADRSWPQDYTSLRTTLTAGPATYRVERVGPFEFARRVTPADRILTAELADRIFETVKGLCPLYVEGSQSPLSVKPPCESSDLDLLVVVSDSQDLALARKTVLALQDLEDKLPVPLSIGVVQADWLGLPGFYSAVNLDPLSLDRSWWLATRTACALEAARRVQTGLSVIADQEQMDRLFRNTFAVLGLPTTDVAEWRVTPRWRGYDVLEQP